MSKPVGAAGYEDPLKLAEEIERGPRGRLLPRFLYRFFRPGHPGLGPAIVHSHLWLSSRDEFNDPFDVRAELLFKARPSAEIRYLEGLAERHGIEPHARAAFVHGFRRQGFTQLQPLFDARVSRFGIACLSSSDGRDNAADRGAPRNVLMWSHYADGHKGVCLVLRRARSFGIFAQAHPVIYTSRFPQINWLPDSTLEQRLGRAFFTKALGWAYEREYRIIAGDRAGSPLPFDGQALAAIVFGCAAKHDFTEQVAQLLAQRAAIGLPSPKLFKAVQSRRGFALSLQKLQTRRHPESPGPGAPLDPP